MKKTVTIQEMKDAVIEVYQDYNGNIPLDFKIRETAGELYGESTVKKYPELATAQAAYLPRDGRAYFQCSRISYDTGTARGHGESYTKGRGHSKAVEVARHEILGHYSLNTSTQQEKYDLLAKIIKSRLEPTLNDAWADVDNAYREQTEFKKAEEVFAFVAEKEPALNPNLPKTNQSKTFTLETLQQEAAVIADGIRRGIRPQKIFPKNNQAQFRQTEPNREEKQMANFEKEFENFMNSDTDSESKTKSVQLDHFEKIDELNASYVNLNDEQKASFDNNQSFSYSRTEIAENGDVEHLFLDESETASYRMATTPELASGLREEFNIGAAKDEQEITLDGEVNEEKKRPVSAELDNRFLINAKGNKTTYAYSNDPDKIVFTEKKNTLIAKETNPSIIRSMLEVAESKGWESITVKGTKEFKRDTWLEAKTRGLDVNGYEPTEQDERKLTALLDKQNTISANKEGSGKESDTDKKDDKGNTKAMPPISVEGQEQRANQLKTAFQTLNKEEAIERHPELEPVYDVKPAAEAFYRAKGGQIEREEEDFKEAATDRAIKDVASGKEIPKFDVSSYKTPTATKERETEIER
ncbi:MAG: hypothetical protein JKY52_08935 [Flavobacteriales bacterium]|nr:hypothetical protein [Flavobacteriales bacterium]